MSTSKEVKDGYISTLADLTFNSKPLINVLTMLAEENIAHAADIVEAIETHLVKVRTEIKLPVLYLIDCIIKNVGAMYTNLFCHNIVSTFCSVFEVVDEKTRGEMFKLRQTWNDVLPKSKLYALDVKVSQLDPAWPVIAPQPSNSIHLNPKFLHTSSIPKKSPPINVPTQSLTTPIITNPEELDPATLDMQQKLIYKRKQLLELQQKKLELELMQTQIKLQEKLQVPPVTNAATVNKTATVKSQNILLKPEVAKQLASTVSTSSSKSKSANAMSSMMNQRLQGSAGNILSGSTPRISPVNSALVAAARPIRDPRLRKQQPANTNANVQIENKSITTDSLGSNNKVIDNKMSVRAIRTEPRVVVNSNNNNKDNVTPHNKPKTLSRSPTKANNSKQSDPSNKSPKSSRSSSKSFGSDGGSSKGSTSSLDSPNKTKSSRSGEPKVNRSAPTSPTKHKKKENANLSRSDKKNEKSTKSSSKSEKESKSPTKSDSSSNFKEIKGVSKSRNYIRRNREISVSPEPSQDVDLRLGGPPEKQARLHADTIEDKSSNVDHTSQNMDVDLRLLPGVINKKRSSMETVESSTPKKSKSEVFDVLFGNEDTDLRQLSSVLSSPKAQERPPTPPPPIISSKSKTEIEEVVEAKSNPKKESPKSNNLDVLRAKLANATSRDKLNQSRFNLLAEQKKEIIKPKPTEDTDLRNTKLDDSSSKIFISTADEQCIKTGNMTKEQETALMNKILAQIENQKLNEAKRKDTEEAIVNISLQPISDDELEADFSVSSSDEESHKKPPVFKDKDERIPPSVVPPVIQVDGYPKFPRNMDRDLRRGNWRGRGRRGLVPRGMRPGRPGPPEPWMRPMNPNGPWRPMPAANYKPHHEPFNPETFTPEIIDVDNSSLDAPEIMDQNSNPPPVIHPVQETPGLIVDCANHDNIKSINIDGIPRDIRYYDEVAIAFMNWDDPREITFQSGSRKVIFDDKDVFLLNFNDLYTEVNINGHLHNIRLGGPTREIYVDGKWYECFFGGPGIGIELDGKITVLKMEGPPPQVKIGAVKRTDLVAGKINLIIDAKTVVPVFLDGKVQKFEIEGKIHTLRFIDALRTVLINDVPFSVEFGGLPKPIFVFDKKHFIRFSVLPRGIKPGHIKIKDMEGNEMPESPRNDTESSMDAFPVIDTNEPALPVFTKRKKLRGPESPDRNSNSPLPLQNLFQQPNFNMDMLTSAMATSLHPSQNPNLSGYQVENIQAPELSVQSQQDITTSAPPVVTNKAPALAALNINELFQKLVATGIVTTAQENVAPTVHIPIVRPTINKKEHTSIKHVTFAKPETLKVRQPFLIHTLYSGMQCSSCGMRFPPEHSMQYSQHLDWHFRQNRKGKKNIRKASSRRWYYSVSDWKNYEEIEDLEEREKSYFENQQQAQTEGTNDEADEEIEIPSVSADPAIQNAKCEVCQDRFDQFYNEEKEEWHLRMAVRIDGKNYHPLCYDDYQASLVDTTLDETNKLTDIPEDVIPGLEVKLDEDTKTNGDDEPPEIIIDDDESEKMTEVSEKVEEEDVKTQDAFPDEDDDDVIINEVVPEKIDLVDDDCKDEEYTSSSTRVKVTVKEEPVDDGFIDVEDGVIKMKNIGEVKIKTEPIDADDEVHTAEEEILPPVEEEVKITTADTPHTEVVTFIDGNVEFDSSVPPSSGLSGKIKINITKTLPVIPPKENKELSSEIETSIEHIDPSQPLPPGEEPIQLNLKPALQGVDLKKLPPVTRGTELTGLCSIM